MRNVRLRDLPKFYFLKTFLSDFALQLNGFNSNSMQQVSIDDYYVKDCFANFCLYPLCPFSFILM